MPNGEIVDNVELCSAEDSFSAFYQEARTNKYVPRAVFVDFEPTVIGNLALNFYSFLKIRLRSDKKVSLQLHQMRQP